MSPLYYQDARGRIYEFEADTNSGVYAWFRRLIDDESVRLRLADMIPLTDTEVLALAKDEAA